MWKSLSSTPIKCVIDHDDWNVYRTNGAFRSWLEESFIEDPLMMSFISHLWSSIEEFY
jgi:hypothetical protein